MINKLNNFIKRYFSKNKIDNLDLDCKINENFNLINPKEIYLFISNNANFIELINLSFIYIKKYFPNSVIYLEFREDPEYEELDAIFAYIYDGTNDYKTNREIFNDLIYDFYDFARSYGKIDYLLSLICEDEYYKNRLKDRENDDI